MKKNFIKKATTALVAVMSVASAAMITTKATGNYSDKYLAVRFTGSGTNPHTKTEGKWDDTSSYISSRGDADHVGDSKYSYTVEVYGAHIGIDAGEGDSFYRYGSNVKNCTCGTPVYVNPNTEHYLNNWVNEWHYENAFLLLWQKKEGYTNMLKGVWSPDSI